MCTRRAFLTSVIAVLTTPLLPPTAPAQLTVPFTWYPRSGSEFWFSAPVTCRWWRNNPGNVGLIDDGALPALFNAAAPIEVHYA